MKSDRPKQLLTLDDTPILIYTIRKFDACRLIDRILVAAPQEVCRRSSKARCRRGFLKARFGRRRVELAGRILLRSRCSTSARIPPSSLFTMPFGPSSELRKLRP